MIKILLKKNKSGYQQCEITGHSGFSKKGADIVCAAASFLIQSITYYALSNNISISSKNYSLGVVFDSKSIVFLELEELHNKKPDLYEYFCTGLALLEKTYKKNIHIQIVEDINGS